MKRFLTDGLYAVRRSAQSYLCANDETATPSGACGAGDDGTKPEPKPAACGSACGTGDK